MALEKIELTRFAVIDMKSPANVYYEITEAVNEDGKQIGAPLKRNEATSLEDVAAALQAFDATVIAANATLNAQNTALQAECDDLRARLNKAVSALQAVRQADTSWDNSPRGEVIAVLEAEAE